MRIEGKWNGFVYFERFRSIIDDDTLMIRIKEEGPNGELSAEIHEIFHMEELRKIKFRQTERRFQAKGHYDREKGTLSLVADMSEEELRKSGGNSIEATVDPEEGTIEGRYFNPYVEGQEQVFKVWMENEQ